ncbi:LIC_10190 family membrane protein [Chryseobacterium sp. 2TAF14]|uniref:LIC_10190 family membrane protein n=1 Tax=Chryseobacterium sp. 2TAF14 TaxID=3233007 RepID=UPI003F8F0F10
MLLILCSSIFLITTLMGWGKLLENSIGKSLNGISGKILTGIFSLVLIFTILSFFVPLNLYIEIPAILIGLFYFFKEKLYLDFYEFSKKDSVILGISAVIILFCGSFHPFILDHFGYYIPSIKWLTEYGLVKGISNLDLILGQMSVWHILQAGFSNFADPFLRLNAILLIVYSIYIVENKSWIQFIFIPVFLIFSQSPSPDLPVIVFSLIILNEILSCNKNLAFLFAFSVFTFAIKPTVIWLPLFILLYSVFNSGFRFKKIILGSFVFLLFIIKNIWTFGFPVFPLTVFDLGIFWKPNPELLKASSQFAIVKTFDEQYSYSEILKFSWLEYITKWLFLDGIKSVINIFFVLSLVGFITFSVIKKNKTISLICISILVKSLLILSFSAQYRFFIDVFFVMFFVVFFKNLNKKNAILISSVLAVAFISLFSSPKIVQKLIPSFKLGKNLTPFEKKQLLKPSYYEYNYYHSFKIGNLKFNVSKKYTFSIDTPVPAISESFLYDYQKEKIFPQLIDKNNLKKGFIWKKLNTEEKKELDKSIRLIEKSYLETSCERL